MGDDHSPLWDRRTFLKATGAVGSAAALGGVGSVSASSSADPSDPTRNTYLVGITNTASVASVQSELPSAANVLKRNEDLGYLEVDIRTSSTYDQVSTASAIQSNPSVRYFEENATYYPLGTPDDPRFSDQYAPQQVRAPTAWDTTEGSTDVTVAIVDQGVKYDHPDLQSRFGSDEGKDFVDDDSDPMPTDLQNEYHGTHVAGIASATTNNAEGVAGMSDSTLLSCRALGTQGGSTSDIADAVKWATDQGADIINMSLGGGGYTDTMKNAVSYAVNNGTLPICAAGNSGNRGVSYPAKYNECMAVSAVDSNENLASFSQYGPNIDVAAPGVDVLSCWTTSTEYNKISGTSMACPAAAGVAALGKAVNPGLSPSELRSKLKNTAVDIGLSEEEQGAGRVDAANIVGGGGGGGGNDSPSASFTVSDATVSPGTSVSFDGSGSSDPDGSIASYSWDFGDGTTASGQTASHSYDSSGDYTVQLTVTDDAGATATASQTVTVESSGGGGSCGDATDTTTKTGSLSGSADGDVYTYTTKLDGTCGVTLNLGADSGTDFDLYVTLDGRTPSTYDYDVRSYNYGSDESISLSDSQVDSGQDLGILVDSYDGAGGYTLDITETGTGGGGGGGGNDSPSASFTVSDATVSPGTSVSFDGSGSSDPDGSIASYSWDFGDGTTASGQTASHSYDSSGDYTVTLTVTDDAGASASTSKTVTVESSGGGGTCGDTSNVVSGDGSLSSSYDDAVFTYTGQLSTPCQVTIALDGPSGADFDLYVTLDGRTPSTYDYDIRSVTYDSQEQVVVDDVSAGQSFGILVDSWDGAGNFTVTVEELGK